MNISLLVGGLDCFGFRSHNLCEYCNQVPVTCVRAAVLTALFLPSQRLNTHLGWMAGWRDGSSSENATQVELPLWGTPSLSPL